MGLGTKPGKNCLIKWGSGSADTLEVQETLKPAPADLKLSGTYASISVDGNAAFGSDGDDTFMPGGPPGVGARRMGPTPTSPRSARAAPRAPTTPAPR
ncbi:hypothetical protein [Deinococcus hopiensis]|uniref:hypothetical protein n=1 Tax=Deinococcus hopiensis TaxID=309885 RepID=UPI000A06CD67|nr:hypothetical protein [Deinococcus hopiensis]